MGKRRAWNANFCFCSLKTCFQMKSHSSPKLLHSVVEVEKRISISVWLKKKMAMLASAFEVTMLLLAFCCIFHLWKWTPTKLLWMENHQQNLCCNEKLQWHNDSQKFWCNTQGKSKKCFWCTSNCIFQDNKIGNCKVDSETNQLSKCHKIECRNSRFNVQAKMTQHWNQFVCQSRFLWEMECVNTIHQTDVKREDDKRASHWLPFLGLVFPLVFGHPKLIGRVRKVPSRAGIIVVGTVRGGARSERDILLVFSSFHIFPHRLLCRRNQQQKQINNPQPSTYRSTMKNYPSCMCLLAILSGIAAQPASSSLQDVRSLSEPEDFCEDVCELKENGHPTEYYDDCGGYDNGYILLKERSEEWCYSRQFEKTICCGEVEDCCEMRWGLVAGGAGAVVLVTIILCILCCLLELCCFRPCSGSRRRRQRQKKEQQQQQQQQTDDEGANSDE